MWRWLSCGAIVFTLAGPGFAAAGIPGASLPEPAIRAPGDPGPGRTVIETEHFCVHTDPPPGDAYADSVAAACERAWHVLHLEMNWDVPPLGGSSGCPDRINCYITDLPDGLLGYTEPGEPVPGGAPYDMTASFYVDIGIDYGCLLNVTVTHQYFHAVEFGYFGYQTADWFMQQCAEMAEEWVCDNCNNYRSYLPSFFNQPYKALATQNGSFELGAIVWPMYLAERFSPELVESIWDRFQWTGNVFTSHDEALAPYGYDMDAAYLEFIRWCFYTAIRNDGQHFEEAGAWQVLLMPDRTFSVYPTGDQHPGVNRRPEGLGTSLMRFNPDPGSTDDVLIVDFDGPDCTLGVQFIVAKHGTPDCDEYRMQLDSSGNGSISIPGFHTQADYAFMLVSMSRSCGSGGRDYVFSANTGPSAVWAEGSNAGSPGLTLRCAPNPNAAVTGLSYRLPSAGSVDLRILTADGRCVRVLARGWRAAGPHDVSWDGGDSNGRLVSAGVYWARIQAGAETVSRRIVRAP